MVSLAEILRGNVSDLNQLRNVARLVVAYTEPRRYNGKGRGRTFAADVETIATTSRQLAEMVLEATKNG